MHRLLPFATASLIATGLLVSAAPASAAPAPSAPLVAPSEPLVVKTVRIGRKRVQFVLAVDSDEKAYVRMKLRRDGRWKTVASDRTDCRYWDGSHDPYLEVQKPDKQVYISWFGPGDIEVSTAEYGGYNVRRTTIEMYGAEACPAAG